ncbi:MAG: hypothetical protein KZQ85_06290 [Candidatus Thiodiazotropha sp. (ex Myrtea sp. 'scaly one' KF741663)]|nr:hypothetical protein [Candidatus Thiodiazotropha sp. (ex Myrtea sp. 'scaly one' KF741663)]
MKNLYIHIGAPKTGSSSIQLFMSKNYEFLKKKYGLLYPSIDNIPNRKEVNGKIFNDLALVKEFIELSYKSECNDIVLSEEILFFEGGYDFFEYLSKNNYIIKIVVYIRNSAEYLSSLWAEHFKLYNLKINIKPIEAFLQNNRYELNLSRLFDYASLFGDESIIIRPYEGIEGFDVVKDFLSIFNISKSDEFIEVNKEERNISVTRKYCDIVNYLKVTSRSNNYSSEEIDWLMSFICGDDRWVIETLSDKLICNICDRYAPIEKKLSSRFLQSNTLFKSRYPYIYGVERHPYIPLTNDDRYKITNFLISRISSC